MNDSLNELPFDLSSALIIPLGAESIENVIKTIPIYFRSDARRASLTRVAAPVITDDGGETGTVGFDVLDYDQLLTNLSWQEQLEERPDALFHSNIHFIRECITNTWNQLRSHKLLLEAQVPGDHLPVYNIIVIADLWDKAATLWLLPILYHLKGLTEDFPNVTFQVLLSNVIFPSEDKTIDQSIRAYRLISEIESRILAGEVQKDDALLNFLQISHDATLDNIKFILFDNTKENGLTVSDRNEFNAILSSFLLSILNGQISEDITSTVSQESSSIDRGFFASAGSTSIIFNSDPIIKYCSLKLGAEYLAQDYFPTTGIDNPAVDHFLSDMDKIVGNEYEWANKLLENSSYSAILTATGWDIDYHLDNLVLDLPAPDEIKQCEWLTILNNYITVLKNEYIPSILDRVSKDSTLFIQKVLQSQEEYISDLLHQIELYPNVLINGSRTLEVWKLQLERKKQALLDLKASLPSTNTDEENLANAIEAIAVSLNKFPPVPFLLRLMPKGKIKSQVLNIYSLIKLIKEYNNLNNALSQAKEQIKAFAIRPVYSLVEVKIEDILDALIRKTNDSIENIASLAEKIRSVQKYLQDEYPKYLPQDNSITGSENFQLFISSSDFYTRCYAKFKPSIENTRSILLFDMKFLEKWQEKTDQDLISVIVRYGEKVFSPIRGIRINQALSETKILGDDPQKITEKVLLYSNSCLCLLNPIWDAVGGTGGQSSQFAQIDSENNILLYSLINDQWRDRKIIYSNDPYYYTFLRIRHRIPLTAFIYLFEEGKKAWNALSLKEQKKRDVFPQTDLTHPPVIIFEKDEENIQKKFRWIFTPKGSPNSFEQEISIEINKNRYDEYHNKERFVQSYNLYSEEETPEIRALAREFQRLHSEHNWSTYNQAYNILTFVQSCIPYSFDKDSTSFNDWARYPIETLMDGTGDCEDVAILCGAILARLGFSSVLLEYPSHLAFGVQASDSLKGEYVFDETSNKKYYYGEATSKGWRLGEIPREYQSTKPQKIYPINITITE